ncbi:hypothetical protein RUND412_000684 [Rhizina undulata]
MATRAPSAQSSSFPSPPSASAFSPNFVSPKLQSMIRGSRPSAGSYGCQKEVFHPLSPNAEPSAVIYYETSSDEDEVDEEVRRTPPNPRSRLSQRQRLSSPLTASRGVDDEADTAGKFTLLPPPPNPPVILRRLLRVLDDNAEDAEETPEDTKHTTPVRMPLPDSDGDWSEPDESEHSDDDSVSSAASFDDPLIRGLSPSTKRYITGAAGFPMMNSAMALSQSVAEKLKQLDIKASEHSFTTTRPLDDPQFHRELNELYEKSNFDPRVAALLEDRFQSRLRKVYERRIQEEYVEAQRLQAERERRAKEARAASEAALRKAMEEKMRQAEEEDRQRREKEEQERRAKEEEMRKAAEKARAEVERRRDEETKKRAEMQKAQEEQAARQKAAHEAMQKKADAEAKANQDQAQAVQQEQQVSTVYGRKSMVTEVTAVNRVLQALKKLRKVVENQPDFMTKYNLLGIRRTLRPKLGQLNGDRAQTIHVRDTFKKEFLTLSSAMDGHTVPASDFFLYPDESSNVQIPVAFIWMVNELAKMVVKQVESECAIKPENADPIGVAVISAFADNSLLINGKSFIDIIIARLLKRNPILRGEVGPEDTKQDRIRLGWILDENGQWETEEEHINRLVGLTAGYTAIAGRDFGASKLMNPYPIFNLWHAVAALLSKPMDKLTNSHFFVMKTLVQVGAKKLVGVYGHQAKKLVTVVIRDWALKGAELGFGGASGIKAFGKMVSEESWWKEV